MAYRDGGSRPPKAEGTPLGGLTVEPLRSELLAPAGRNSPKHIPFNPHARAERKNLAKASDVGRVEARIEALDTKLSGRIDTVVLELGKAFGRPTN